MIIEQTQIKSLEASQFDTFLDKMTVFIQENDSQLASQGYRVCHDVAEYLTKRAWNYGLQEEDQVSVYVCAGLSLGADFESRHPIAGDTLSHPDLSAATKTIWLKEWTLANLD